jgi:hypothetical protein
MTVDLAVGIRTVRRVSTAHAVVPSAVAAMVVLRLLLAGRPATPDEGGFLVVASQWHVGGSSLYGNYWVDRPPLLIGIFRLADLIGGLVALRVIGAVAAAATVVLLAGTARRVFDQRAGNWTAVVAAALLVSPLLGADAVNGELLAAPFIALGLRFAVEAICADDALAVRGSALGAGLAAVLALLVKQNMADVVVFATVCWVVAWRTGRLSGRTCRDLFALAIVGGVVGYAVVMLWSMAKGTSPLGVYEATYPFRLKAGRVLVEGAGQLTRIRLGRIAVSAVVSGMVLILFAFLALALRRAAPRAVAWALVASGAFATVSVLSGGSYWLHYLVQGVPIVSLATGALSTVPLRAAARATPVLVSMVVVSALVALTAVIIEPEPAPGHAVGSALATSAQPGDTVLSAFGDADILQTSGMSSPYPYLWSLPTRTLDPNLRLLRGELGGPEAPTWIVVRNRRTMNLLDRRGVWPLVEERYQPVGRVCGRFVYLLRGVTRPPLEQQARCGGLVLP